MSTQELMVSSRLFRSAVLPLAGLLILGLVWERESREHSASESSALLQQLAPQFELNDQNSRSVRLKAYLGRTRCVVLFFDGELGADRDPLLRPLIDHYGALQRAGVELFAISLATPFANREAEKRLGSELPFSLLTDIDIRNPAPAPTHRQWGRYDDQADKPLQGLFLIDRRGYVTMDEQGRPLPVQDPLKAIYALSVGEWPDQ